MQGDNRPITDAPTCPFRYESKGQNRKSDLTPAEQFWIIKHGVKMTGMPAWGITHDDELLWDVVAFLRKLPELTAEQY